MHRIRFALASCALLVVLGSTAHAQQDSMVAAKNAFDDGQNLYLQSKFAAAAAKFLEAYNHKHYAAFLFNAAVCFEKNKNFAKALKYYEQFAKEDPHSNDIKNVKQRIAAIRKHLSPPTSQPGSQPTAPVVPSLPPVQTKGLVVIESQPEGAAIYLNDKKNGIFTRTPYTGSLPPGKHMVILELKDYRTERKTFIVRNDRLTYLYFGLSVEKNLGWIEVKANIPGAKVYVDDKTVGAVGRTPYSGNQRPGKRKIIVERVGYEPVVKEVNIVAGKTHTVRVALEKVKYGWIKVTGRTTKGGKVFLDDKVVPCKGYPCRTRAKIGTHRVKVQRDGFKSYEHTVEVAQAAEVKLAVRLHPKPPRIKAYVSLGVAAALLAGGIVTGVLSKNRGDSLEDDLKNRRLYDSGDGRFLEGKILAIVANSLFGLAGIAGALGIYYLFRNEGPDSYGEAESKVLAVTPSFGPRSAGITAQLRF